MRYSPRTMPRLDWVFSVAAAQRAGRRRRRAFVACAPLLVAGLWAATAGAADVAAPPGWFGLSLNLDVDGFVFKPVVRAATVLDVADHSPAAAGHVQSGDQVLEVEGQPVTGTKARTLQAALAKAVGDVLHLRLRRSSGEAYVVALTAERRPP